MMRNFYPRKKSCHFCKQKIDEIDYKDAQTLRRFLGIWSRIRPAKNTGTCTKHQRRLSQAIKRARFLALLPYVTR